MKLLLQDLPARHTVPSGRYIFRGRFPLIGSALVLAALSACAPLKPSASPADPAAPPAASASAAAPVLPDVALDDNTLYQLLIAEIAAQRGEAAESFLIEYNLAKETRDPRLARRATEFAVMAHQMVGAAQAAKLWSELDPQSAEARGTLLLVLISEGRYDDAEPVLAEAIHAAKPPGPVFIQIAQTLSKSPDRKGALALLQRLAAPYPSLPEAHLAVAELAYTVPDMPLAIAEAKTATSLAPDDETAPIVLAQYMQESDPGATDAELQSFLRRHPQSTPVRIAYARFLIGQTRFDDAGAQFRIILQAHPRDAETLYALGHLAYQADRLPEAESYFRKFVAVREQEPPAGGESGDDDDAASGAGNADAGYLYLAQIAQDQKHYDEALDDLSHVGPGDQHLSAQLQRATILSRMGKLDQAMKELHDLPAQNQRERVAVLLEEAELLTDAKRGDEALKLIQDGLKTYPGDADLLYDEGMTAERMNRLDLMESSLRTLIKLHPENAQAYNALGYSFADHNMHLEEARDLIEKAITLAPDDASIIDSLGWVQYRLGNNQQALENLMKAYRLRSDADIAVHIGEVLWVSGKHDEAEKYWTLAERKDPSNESLQATLARFNVKIGER